MPGATLDSLVEREALQENSVYNSLRPNVKDTLTYEQQELVTSLDNFEAHYLQEKLLKDGKFESPEQYQEAFTEFKKYVALSEICEKKMSMMSKEVDEVWHQFILFTPQYHKFCKEMLGGYFHHIPKTSLTPLNPKGRENFFESYKEVFGEVPKIWAEDAWCILSPCDECTSGCAKWCESS